MTTIPVMYSCRLCFTVDRTVHVPARPSEMDVRDWMEQTIRVIGVDHALHAPQCITTSLQDLKIPITDAEWIGGPPIS